MKKIVKTILLFFFLTGCGSEHTVTQVITTSPNKVDAVGLEAAKGIKYVTNEFEENNERDNLSKSYKKDDNVEMKKFVEKVNNSINIPNVCDKSIITIGSTQADVDKYDICLMTKAAAEFGEGKPILIGGHNTKSFKYLYRTKINDIIEVTYFGIDYEYKVVYSHECTSSGMDLTDIETGLNMLDYNSNKEVLHIYTCYNSNNWLVKAIRI